jgi:hypothetical protein
VDTLSSARINTAGASAAGLAFFAGGNPGTGAYEELVFADITLTVAIFALGVLS